MHVCKVTGFQQFTSSALASVSYVSSALLLDAQGNKANAAFLTVGASTASCGIRFRDDGTAPSTTVGHFLPYGVYPFLYQGDLQKIAFIASVGNPDLNITYVQVQD